MQRASFAAGARRTVARMRFRQRPARYVCRVRQATRVKVSALEGFIGLAGAIGIAIDGASWAAALIGGLIIAALIVGIEFLAASR
jgi:hypothetical protein